MTGVSLQNGSSTGTVHKTGPALQSDGQAQIIRKRTGPEIQSDGHGQTMRTKTKPLIHTGGDEQTLRTIYGTRIIKQTRITQGNTADDVITRTTEGRSYQYFMITF